MNNNNQNAIGEFIFQFMIEYLISTRGAIILILISAFLIFHVQIIDFAHDQLTYFGKKMVNEHRVLFCHLPGGETDFEEGLIRELGDMGVSENYEIIFKELYQQSPKDSADARRLALKKNADLIIWGYYRENEAGDLVPVYRYYLTEKILIGKNRLTGEEILTVNTDWKDQGFLVKNVSSIINWIHGISAYQIGNYKESAKFLLSINIDDFTKGENYSFYHDLSDILLALGETSKAKSIQKEVVAELATQLPHKIDHKALAKSYMLFSQVLAKDPVTVDSALLFAHRAFGIVKEHSLGINLEVLSLLTINHACRDNKNQKEGCENIHRAFTLVTNIDSIAPHLVSTVYNDFALCNLHKDSLLLAISLMKESLKIEYSIPQKSFARLGKGFSNLSQMQVQKGDLASARFYLDSSLYYRTSYLPENSPEIANAYNSAMQVLYNYELFDGALDYANAAIEILRLEKNKRTGKELLLNVYLNKLVILQKLEDRIQDIKETAQLAYPLNEELSAGLDYYILAIKGRSFQNLGVKCNLPVMQDSAIHAYKQALEAYSAQEESSYDPSQEAAFHHDMGYSYYQKRDWEMAKKKMLNAITTRGVKYAETDLNAMSLRYLGEIYLKQDSIEIAHRYAEQSYNIFTKNHPDGGFSLIDSSSYLLQKISSHRPVQKIPNILPEIRTNAFR